MILYAVLDPNIAGDFEDAGDLEEWDLDVADGLVGEMNIAKSAE